METMRYRSHQRAGELFSLMLALLSLALVLSSPALAASGHQPGDCASAHHEAACCAEAASGDLNEQSASKASETAHVLTFEDKQ